MPRDRNRLGGSNWRRTASLLLRCVAHRGHGHARRRRQAARQPETRFAEQLLASQGKLPSSFHVLASKPTPPNCTSLGYPLGSSPSQKPAWARKLYLDCLLSHHITSLKRRRVILLA
ncbi:hypothetical protein IQ07DRAFT_391763 [Pyrenochaeta sp. DS3sAY3a]|nr:hypothetical protein IQ07DRAFT_391763 [Pyrenochaeta sp. DS3sAY3a]